MNKECGIVRDLMPLVIDDVAGSESKEYVENHLIGCEECKKVFQEMNAEIPGKTEKEKGNEQKAFSAAAGKLKKKRRFRTLKHVLLGILIASIVFGAGLFGYGKLAQVREHVYYGFYKVYLSELDNNRVVFTMDYRGSYDDLSTTVKEVSETDPKTGEKKLIMYVYLEKYKIPRKMQDPNQNQFFMVLTAENMAEYSEIRLGVPEEYQTIWVQGQQITKASEQMNEYFFWSDIKEKMWDFTRESTDGKVAYTDFRISIIELIVHNQMYAIASTVPEWQPWVSGRQIELTDQETILWALSGLREAGIQINKPNPYESLPNNE